MGDWRYRYALNVLRTFIDPEDQEALDEFDTYEGNLRRLLRDHALYGGEDSGISKQLAGLNSLARRVTYNPHTHQSSSFNDMDAERLELAQALRGILAKLPAEKARQSAARLYYLVEQDSDFTRLPNAEILIRELLERYAVPFVPRAGTEPIVEPGPAIDWRGPDTDVELQSWLSPAPDMLDVGFLKQAVVHSAAVCRVELPAIGRKGTAFLVAPDLILTNYHVLKDSPDEDIDGNARSIRLRFGYLSGMATPGASIGLCTTEPLLGQSPPGALDYVLLRLETRLESLHPVTLANVQPALRTGLHILQHPSGGTMKLALDANGVTGVYPERGQIQYVTQAATGSSGAPCFNEGWEVVALHHAERARTFGAIREGILIDAIRVEIGSYL